jgi:predicted dehydrogenase
MTENYRFAVVGAGTIFPQHRLGIEAVEGEYAGIVDIDVERGGARAKELGCPFFTDIHTMLAEVEPDVVSVITPHPFHPEHSIAGLEAGCHVLVEKPIAVQVKEAETMIAAAEASDRILAVNFQQRLRPEVIAARQVIQDGLLGDIQNADMKMTWTRTAIYFNNSSWRGTWNGEGGGVLLNQAPHELDLLCYLLGMPARVFAWTRNLIHRIETEDTIQVMLEWDNGALGSIHISTAEAGQPQRFEIIGTSGRLALGPGELHFKRFDTDVRKFIATSDNPFGHPNLVDEQIALQPGAGNHVAIYHNLVNAITHGTPVIADARSSSMSLELANAIAHSSYTNQAVEFPLDQQAYADLLAELRAAVS